MRRWTFAVQVVPLVVGVSLACREVRPSAEPAYVAAIEKQRAARLAELTSDVGWLTLVGIHWLQPGANRLGAGATNNIVLHGDGVPEFAGVLEVAADGGVILRTSRAAGFTLGGEPVAEAALRTDRQGSPDVLEIAGLRMNVIDRSGSLALRVRDPRSPRRSAFKGISYFAIDPRLKVEATLERYRVPREVTVATAQGPAQRMLAPGLLRFTIGTTPCTLEPFADSPEAKELFIVFGDATGGRETYGAGRFLDAAAPAPGRSDVILDFNLAYNPPCAFTPYATCPLPPARNILSVPIRAGERDPGGH
jgi:hypothetical protein